LRLDCREAARISNPGLDMDSDEEGAEYGLGVFMSAKEEAGMS
jgi:hypothetical protein